MTKITHFNFCNNFFFFAAPHKSKRPEIRLGTSLRKDGGNVTKQPTKTKGFNTNNEKCKKVIYGNQTLNTNNRRCKKKQVQTNTDILDSL